MAGPATRPRWPLVLGALGVVLAVQALFVVSYVGALHAPAPRSVPFGVVGPPALVDAVGTRFSLRTIRYTDEAAAKRAIDRRQAYGALVTTSSAGLKLVVAPAAGNAVATALTTAFTTAAAAGGRQLTVVQVHPLPSGDRSGAVPFLVVMALVIGGYLSATIATTIGGPATRRWRAPVLAGVAVIGSLATDLVAGPLLGAIPTDKFLVLWALFAFVMLAVAWAAAALQVLFGPVGTLIVIVVFVIFGAPAAGGTVPRPFLPSFWGTIGPYLPPGAGTTAVRNTIYFGGHGIGRALSSSPSISSSAVRSSSVPAARRPRRHSTPRARQPRRPSSWSRRIADDGRARDEVLQRAPPVVDEHRQQPEAERHDREPGADQAEQRAAEARRRAGRPDHSHTQEAHSRRLAGERPEPGEVDDVEQRRRGPGNRDREPLRAEAADH